MKKETLKKIIFLVLVMVFLSSVNVSSFAADVPNTERKGSITVTLKNGNKVVSGGSLTMYKVADVYESDGNYGFKWMEDFVNCSLHLDNIQSEKLAKDLADYAKDNCEGVTQKISANGTVEFNNLSVGLYLMVQTENSKNYNSVNPFLVTIPLKEDGEYVYDVNASPKVEVETTTKQDAVTTVPSTEQPSTEPNLPSTGQLRWPIPVLALSGIIFFVVGFTMYSSRRKETNEK